MKNKDKAKTPSPNPPLLHKLNFTPWLLNTLPLPHPKQCRGMGNGELQSMHSNSFLPLLPAHTFPLLHCGVSPTGYSPSRTVHEGLGFGQQ